MWNPIREEIFIRSLTEICLIWFLYLAFKGDLDVFLLLWFFMTITCCKKGFDTDVPGLKDILSESENQQILLSILGSHTASRKLYVSVFFFTGLLRQSNVIHILLLDLHYFRHGFLQKMHHPPASFNFFCCQATAVNFILHFQEVAIWICPSFFSHFLK